MEEQKQTFNWQRLLITAVMVIVAACAVGGTTYYVLNSNFQKERDANEKAISDVQNQLKTLTEKTTKTSTTATTPVTTSTAKTVKDFTSQQISTVIDAYLKQSGGRTPTIADGGYSLGTVIYADLDGNGKQYALVPLIASGSGVDATLYVLTVSNDSLKVQTVEKGGSSTGHNKFTYSNGKLSETFPVYKEGDPNCCPTGGNQTLYYTWSNGAFNGAN